jgi:transposase
MTRPLFQPDDLQDAPSPAEVAHPTSPPGKPRLRVPIRDQVEVRWDSLDQLLEDDHPARTVWAAVGSLDLSAWLGAIKAVEHHVGRDATDPRLLVALWVYATLKAVGSARELARLCRECLPYQWLCGGVTVNYHLLSDFRSQGGEKWDQLLTQIVGALLSAELVTMDRVAQDGMRVRADAGPSSFRRRGTLEACLDEARQQVEALKAADEEQGNEATHRQAQARRRAARERQERLEEALRQCAELQRQREASAKQSGRKVEAARASTTDPEARTMKFPDGGYRPGYNVQFATDTATGVIVGVEVTNAGTDGEQLAPMVDQLEERSGRVPDEVVVDGGFATVNSVEQATERGCTVYAPLKDEQKQLTQGKDPYAPKKHDTEAIAAWRARMGTQASKAVYKLRGQVAEWVNAQCRNRGLWFLPVRGRVRCRIVGLLYAVTHNLLLAGTLRAQAAAEAVGA